jgi:Radical SAM superfamily
MIIRITNRCHMGCQHCMIDGSGPDGQHMTEEVYRRALTFAHDSLAPVVLIGGGEPTEHPEFISYLRLMCERVPCTVITSNGDFRAKPGVADQIERLGAFVQVTNDPRYYPRRIEPEQFTGRDGWTYADELRVIFPCRRTQANGIEATRQYPGCVNLRAAVRRFGLRMALVQLAAAGKHCPPSVNVDGTIRAGEADTCHRIGQVGEPLDVIEHRLVTMRCNVCGLRDNLKPEHLAAIGEV